MTASLRRSCPVALDVAHVHLANTTGMQVASKHMTVS